MERGAILFAGITVNLFTVLGFKDKSRYSYTVNNNRNMKGLIMRRFILVFTALLSLTAFTQPVLADQKGGGPWERFSFNLGGFITSLNSDVRIGIEQIGPGIEIDVEDALGLDSSTSVNYTGVLLYTKIYF